VNNEHSDWIYLGKIRFPCIVGLYEDEQRTPQALAVELGMSLDLDAASGGDLSQSVHYVTALDQVQFIAQEGRWRLLESLAAAILRHLLRVPAPAEGRALIERAKVRVSKPGYLKGRAIPSVELVRERSWCGAEPTAPPAGASSVHPLTLTPKSGAYHVDLGAGARFELPDGMSAFVLAGDLAAPDGRELGRGSILHGGEAATNGAGGGRLLAVGAPLLAPAR
jgi:FolB domain-containing protein